MNWNGEHCSKAKILVGEAAAQSLLAEVAFAESRLQICSQKCCAAESHELTACT
jgi:hypothetical protein